MPGKKSVTTISSMSSYQVLHTKGILSLAIQPDRYPRQGIYPEFCATSRHFTYDSQCVILGWLSLLMSWGLFVFNDKFHCTLTKAYYKMITGTLSLLCSNQFLLNRTYKLMIQAFFHLFILPLTSTGVSHDSYPEDCNSTHLSSRVLGLWLNARPLS